MRAPPAPRRTAASIDDLPKLTADILQALRTRRPRVHCITNSVAQAFTANMLLAIGALPSMTISPEEISPFVARADALLVNLGTFDAERREAVGLALAAAAEKKLPWVLDPVLIDRSPPRAEFARTLVRQRPRAIRLNAGEFTALAQADPKRDAVMKYAADSRAVVGLTGETDLIADGERAIGIANGHPLMARVTAMGCAGSALVAAFLAVESDPLRASAAAILTLGIAGEIAAEHASGPGSFAAAVIDATHNIEGDAVTARAKVSVMRVDLRLYALVDPERSGGRDTAALAKDLVEGGATLVQLRDKLGSTRRMIEQARAIKAALAKTGVPLLINDQVDVALAAGADGVHVGWDDMAAEDARNLLGREAIIGLSIKTKAQADAAPLALLDYVCIGGVFETMSKDNPDPPIGAAGFRELAAIIRGRAPRMPVGAIAGIDRSNAAQVVAAGADGIAVISALSLAPDPANAARELRTKVDRALTQRGAA